MTQTTATPPSGALARAPLGGRYGVSVAMALLALAPFIILTTASAAVDPQIATDLGATAFGVSLAGALATALYAFGAVLAADLSKRITSRWIFLACEVLFVVGSVMSGASESIVSFTIGRCLQGLATGLLLIVAVPPLVIGNGPEKIPATAFFVNLGLFGMVALGPIVGGLAGATGRWRLMFFLIGLLGVLGLVGGLLAFRWMPPRQPGARFDWGGVPLALPAAVLPFIGVSYLSVGSYTDPVFIGGVTVGLAALVLLVVVQKREKGALTPVALISSTLPLGGIVIAMAAGAAFTGMLQLAQLHLTQVERDSPLLAAALVSSAIVGVLVAALTFKRVLGTRWLTVFALTGLVGLAAAGVLLLVLDEGNAHVLVPVAALLLGYGAGAGVTPALFVAALSVASNLLGPTFALVELLRSVAAFLIVPVLVYITTITSTFTVGYTTSVAVMLGVVVLAGLAVVATLVAGGWRPSRPDLATWLSGDEPAYDSPPFLARLRRSR